LKKESCEIVKMVEEEGEEFDDEGEIEERGLEFGIGVYIVKFGIESEREEWKEVEEEGVAEVEGGGGGGGGGGREKVEEEDEDGGGR
jgi:hypothetical protein